MLVRGHHARERTMTTANAVVEEPAGFINITHKYKPDGFKASASTYGQQRQAHSSAQPEQQAVSDTSNVVTLPEQLG